MSEGLGNPDGADQLIERVGLELLSHGVAVTIMSIIVVTIVKILLKTS